MIKSHHNVGGLPDHVDFKEIIEPLRMLFKDEVRQLGRELGLPEYLVERQPFPGPGLAIRVIGDLTKDKLDTLRLADAIYREEIAKAGLNQEINQYFAVLTNTRSVGVMGDGRTYDYTLALRAVTTSDFMTADWARIPYEVLDKVSRCHRRRGRLLPGQEQGQDSGRQAGPGHQVGGRHLPDSDLGPADSGVIIAIKNGRP